MPNVSSDDDRARTLAGREGVEVQGQEASSGLPLGVITVTVWSDTEPEVDSPLADWLTEAVLYRAGENLSAWTTEDDEQEEE
jgi:hypothetical protein